MKANAVKKTNVDTDYNRHVKEFTQEYKQIPLKKQHLTRLQAEYQALSHKKLSEMSSDQISDFYRLKNEIGELSKEIDNTEQLNKVGDFYLKTGHLLIDYYDSIEQTKSSQEQKFGGPPASDQRSDQRSDQHSDQRSDQRGDLYEQYLAHTDPHHVISVEYNKADDVCHKCGVERELNASDAIMVCPKCGEEIPTVMDSDKPSYRDPPHENMYFAYKRINHFKEQLSHFQAKETTKIPQEIYDIILVEFKKEKKTNLATLSRSRVKKYLQKYGHLGYNKYYENINQIICHMNGIQPFSMKPDVEEQLCSMFQKIQEPFEKHRPVGRTNFLSYSYVIYKFCQLLGYNEYLQYFNLLKSKDKLRQQDKIWKNICAELEWKYYPY